MGHVSIELSASTRGHVRWSAIDKVLKGMTPGSAIGDGGADREKMLAVLATAMNEFERAAAGTRRTARFCSAAAVVAGVAGTAAGFLVGKPAVASWIYCLTSFLFLLLLRATWRLLLDQSALELIRARYNQAVEMSPSDEQLAAVLREFLSETTLLRSGAPAAGAVPPDVTGRDNGEQKNRRRVELIGRQARGGLTAAEARELEALQEQATRRAEAGDAPLLRSLEDLEARASRITP